MKNILVILLLLSITYCTHSPKSTPSTQDQIEEMLHILVGHNLRSVDASVSAPDAIKEEVIPLYQKAEKLCDNAFALYKDKSLQYMNRPPYKKLNKKELLDSLKSIESLEELYVKKATELEIAYDQRVK